MFHNLVNTQYFKQTGIDYFKNGGHYTLAPRGSIEYYEFWKQEEKRCREGYRVADTWITGRHYFHLNFQPMLRVKEDILISEFLKDQRSKVTGKISSRIAEKVFNFPFFSEMQYEWWRFKHIAWNGGTFMGINSPGGKHMVCAKTREAGFSYMEAADGVYNFNFIPQSRSYFVASKEAYLIEDGILNKVQVGLDWINDNSIYWRQNRQKRSSLSDMHFKASFLDEYGEERGAMSEIIGVTINSDPNKVRGKRGIKLTFEEAGSFKDLMGTLEIAKGNISAGTRYMGQITVFGTGGEEGPSIEGLETLFTNPAAHDFLEFPNIYERGAGSDTVGFFVPCYKTNFECIDQDGNIDYQKALVLDDEKRTMAKKDKNPKALDRRKAEYPQRPSELFQRLSKNGFNVHEIDQQIRLINSSKAIQGLLRHGNLVSSQSDTALGGVEFILNPNANPINHYPHDDSDDLTGCVTIVERPYKDVHGKVPTGMYQVVFDAVYKDDAEDKTSLFDIRVFKQDNNVDNGMAGLPVCWFTGRPGLTRCYEILFNMCAYYNCTAQGEISGGGKGVVDYAKQKRLLHRLEFEPEMTHNKEIASNQRNRSYLMNMATERKRLGMAYLEEWHMEVRGIDDKGNPVYNIHRIYDLGLLREMRKGGVSNSDRLSSCLIMMFMLKENISKRITEIQTQRDFYTRPLFVDSYGGGSESTTTLY